jgi:hypothetical protein
VREQYIDNSRSSTAPCINLYITINRFFLYIKSVQFYFLEVRVALDICRQNSYPNEFSSRSWCRRSTTQRIIKQKTSRLSSFYFPNWMLRLCFSKCRPAIPQDGVSLNFMFSIARKSVEKIQVSWKSDRNNEYFTWRHLSNISLNSSRNEKCFRQKLYSKWKQIF